MSLLGVDTRGARYAVSLGTRIPIFPWEAPFPHSRSTVLGGHLQLPGAGV